MGTLLEGIEAVRLPCTFALLLPALGLALAAGSRAPGAVASFIVGAGGLAWARAAGHWSIAADGLATLAAALVLGAAVATVMWRRAGSGLVLPAAAAGGATIGWIWRPCVGNHLAAVLNDAPTAPVRTLALTIVYIGGACLIAVIVAALPVTFPNLARWRDHRVTTAVGGVAVLVVAVLIAVGLYDDLVAELLRRSSI